MFAFEFTILLITALSTAGRYGLSITEKFIVQRQINARRLARQAAGQELGAEQQEEEDEEELDLVWEEKGTWMFYLELATGIATSLNFAPNINY